METINDIINHRVHIYIVHPVWGDIEDAHAGILRELVMIICGVLWFNDTAAKKMKIGTDAGTRDCMRR